MLKKPKLKEHYQLATYDQNTSIIVHETGHRIFQGKHYALVLPLIDGRRTSREIFQALDGQLLIPEVIYVLKLLEEKGYVVEADPEIDHDSAAFWQALGADTCMVREKLQSVKASLYFVGTDPCPEMERALCALGVRVVGPGEEDVAIVSARDYLQPELARFNREALRTKKAWFLIKPLGIQPWIGPILLPGETACWQCMATRLRANRPVARLLETKLDLKEPLLPNLGFIPVSSAAIAHLAITKLALWLAETGSLTLTGKLWSLDLSTQQHKEHVTVRMPQCRECGEAHYLSPGKPVPLVLASQTKIHNSGGFRTVAPEQTIETYIHHVSPITGAVRQLETLPGPDWAHNVLAGPNLATTGSTLSFLTNFFRKSSLGKGQSPIQAKASGLGEALERYSGVYQGYESRIVSTFHELGTAIHPNECMLYSERQYKERGKTLSPENPQLFRVPKTFDPEYSLGWAPYWSISDEVWRYLPMQYSYYDYNKGDEPVFCHGDSNGCASGNTLEEAILQGMLELIERDAVAIWWYNRLSMPGIDFDHYDEPYFRLMEKRYKEMGRRIWVLDLTHDLGVPCFTALSADKNNGEIIMGFGAHLEPQIGITRALTEMNQMLPIITPRKEAGGERVFGTDNPEIIEWLNQETLETQPYLLPSSTPSILHADVPKNHDLRDDIQYLVQLLKRHDMETLVLDQTRPDIGLPTVKVAVPGLRHFWQRFAPGRLYEIPVKMALREQPLTEMSLNSIPMFL